MTLVLTSRGRPEQRLDLSPLVPHLLAGKSATEIAAIAIQTTRVRVTVGDVDVTALRSDVQTRSVRRGEGREPHEPGLLARAAWACLAWFGCALPLRLRSAEVGCAGPAA